MATSLAWHYGRETSWRMGIDVGAWQVYKRCMRHVLAIKVNLYKTRETFAWWSSCGTWGWKWQATVYLIKQSHTMRCIWTLCPLQGYTPSKSFPSHWSACEWLFCRVCWYAWYRLVIIQSCSWHNGQYTDWKDSIIFVYRCKADHLCIEGGLQEYSWNNYGKCHL